jgi:hypothetical protein
LLTKAIGVFDGLSVGLFDGLCVDLTEGEIVVITGAPDVTVETTANNVAGAFNVRELLWSLAVKFPDWT